MANRQAIASGAINPIYVNETSTRDAITSGPVYVNQTIVAAATVTFIPARAMRANLAYTGYPTM